MFSGKFTLCYHSNHPKDGAGKYEVIGTVTAGTIPTFKVSPGKVARITTGSPVPEGADAVVMVTYLVT
jgi:molybdopterin biosynthesis enzyme